MNAPTEAYAARRSPELMRWLRGELRSTPGRGAAVARIAFNCTITVVVAMVYQIPLPAYMAYIVFLVSQRQRVATLVTAVAGAVAATLAIALTLLFYTLDASEPAFRLPLMAASTFVGFFFARTSTIGPIAFLAAFVLVLSQTLIDNMPSPEALTRLVLWLWVIVTFPAALTTLVDLVFGRDPAKLARRTVLRVLDEIAGTLRGEHSIDVDRLQFEALELLELRRHAQMADRRLRARAEVDHRIIELLVELLTLLRALPRNVPEPIRAVLTDACRQCRSALAYAAAPLPPRPTLAATLLRDLTADVRPVVVAIGNALGRFYDELARRREASDPPDAKTSSNLFVADAWTNPEYVQFALKTTIAVMAAYVIYTVLDWPGIRTAVVTCFFVALSSLGETIHKLTLRLSGALIGGLAAGLCIVYLFPHLTDIGQLALVVTAASAACAWVATSSELLSYAGLQMAFAFFIGALQSYGPATEVTVLRDRMVGILLGNLLISISFSVLWPTSAFDRARSAMARALRTLGNLIRDVTSPAIDARLTAIQALADARRFVSIAVFEADLLRADRAHERIDESAVHRLDQLGAAAFVVADQSGDPHASRELDAATSSWFEETAHRVEVGEPAPRAPDPALIEQAQASVSVAAAPSLRAAVEARILLQREIEHVATTAR
jgi:multidrug resistance protein MdtO